MSTIERAIEIAACAHAGQLDRGGEPYIYHPLRVMGNVDTLEARIVAVLHDVVEDSELTLDDLRAEGFSEEVLAAVDALTKRDGESRLDAAMRAAANPLARVVKLADVNDNMNRARLGSPSRRDRARQREYEQVKKLLELAL